jgi:Fe-S-cluster containining protein
MSRLSRTEALRRLAGLMESVMIATEAERARPCETCDARCCKSGRNGMLASPLEAEAVVERLLGDPALKDRLPELKKRVAAVAAALRNAPADGELPTYDCPFVEDDRCLIHGTSEPLGCLTFMPLTVDACDHHIDVFEEAFEELMALNEAWSGSMDPEGEPMPVAVDRVLRSRSG